MIWEVFARKAYEDPLHHVGTVTEDDVLVRWKARGPMNETYVAKLQKGYRG